jgi:glucosamine 6-phosphate synthetase-like amidotransferase/phosphosugar isomerase protein
VIATDAPDTLVGARVGSPLVIAYGESQNFLASDALAVARHAKQMTYLEEGDGTGGKFHECPYDNIANMFDKDQFVESILGSKTELLFDVGTSSTFNF